MGGKEKQKRKANGSCCCIPYIVCNIACPVLSAAAAYFCFVFVFVFVFVVFLSDCLPFRLENKRNYEMIIIKKKAEKTIENHRKFDKRNVQFLTGQMYTRVFIELFVKT